jgi:hypothetical protein
MNMTFDKKDNHWQNILTSNSEKTIGDISNE